MNYVHEAIDWRLAHIGRPTLAQRELIKTLGQRFEWS